MKRKVKIVSIDGIEKTGKGSVATQLWFKYLESPSYLNEKKDLDLIRKCDKSELNTSNYTIRGKTFLSKLYNDLKKGSSLSDFEKNNEVLIKEERELNRVYGSVYFFIIPNLNDFPKHIKKTNEIEYLIKFFKGINQYTIAQGVDIRLIPLNSDDRILDVTEKIQEILDKEYLFV